jgi:uncharacterized protein YktA (UPF0223 family)
MGKSRKFKKIVKAKAMTKKVENALEEGVLKMMPVSRYSSELLRLFADMEQAYRTSKEAGQETESRHLPRIMEIAKEVETTHGRETLDKIQRAINSVSSYGLYLDYRWNGTGQR